MKNVTSKNLRRITFNFDSHVIEWHKGIVEIKGIQKIGYTVYLDGKKLGNTTANPNISNSLDWINGYLKHISNTN